MVDSRRKFYGQHPANSRKTNLPKPSGQRRPAFPVADEQKAKALYVKLRVEQLEREVPHSTAEVVQEAWPAITTGQAFVCPFCGADTTAPTRTLDLSRADRYYCQACKRELIAERANPNRPLQSKGLARHSGKVKLRQSENEKYLRFSRFFWGWALIAGVGILTGFGDPGHPYGYTYRQGCITLHGIYAIIYIMWTGLIWRAPI